jgi:hypothetical protein
VQFFALYQLEVTKRANEDRCLDRLRKAGVIR